MSQLEMYRTTLLRKRKELAKLKGDLAKEQAKIAPLQKKILSAQAMITRSKVESTIKSKLRDIDSSNKSIIRIQSNIGKIQQNISKKEKEILEAEKKYNREDERVQKKKIAEEKKKSNQLEQRITYNEQIQEQIKQDILELKEIPKTITVLFFAANPKGTTTLQLDEEVRSIQQKIRMSDYRDSIKFESRWATRSGDILQAINETNPTIVHFSGHGMKDGSLVLLNPDGSPKIVTKEAMSMAISTASDSIRLVVFNACFSESQAENVVKYVDAAIGMSDSVGDEAACIFAAQLYSSIGFGKSLEDSFRQAQAQLMLEGIEEESIPKLYTNNQLDAKDIILVQSL